MWQVVSFETCEELFTPKSPHIALSLAGAEIIANGSGSHHQLRKLDVRIDLVRGATSKAGGVYLYANQKGCDGGRLYFDGCAMIWVNGQMVAQGSQFEGMDEVCACLRVRCHDVRGALIDSARRRWRWWWRRSISARCATSGRSLSRDRSRRDLGEYLGEYTPATRPSASISGHASAHIQASSAPSIPTIEIDFSLTSANCGANSPRAPRVHGPMEEIALGPSGWLWDYLRRVQARDS